MTKKFTSHAQHLSEFQALLEPDHSKNQVNQDRAWLLPYLDVVTLLLALFVLLVSTQANQQSEQEVTNVAKVENPLHLEQPLQVADKEELMSVDQKKIAVDNDIGREFREIIQREGLTDLVDVEVQKSTVKLQIKDSILFPVAEANLTRSGFLVLDKIIPTLLDNPYRISIEGHTDSLPIRTERFPSNWELSASRASTVLRFLADRGIRLERMRAVGYADTVSITDNNSIEGRATNRRVSLVVYMEEENWGN